MISNKLLDLILSDYVLPNETLVTYHFDRKLNRARDIYQFFLILELEDVSGHFFEREVLLGTNYRH